MSINSRISKDVTDVIFRKSAEDKLWRVRQDANFSLADDEDLVTGKRIDYALDELEHAITVTRRAKWTWRFSLGLMLGSMIFLLMLLITSKSGKVDPSSPAAIVELAVLAIALLLSGIGIYLEDIGHNIVLFWAAHANNLTEDEEIDQDTKDEVKYWTKKALKLIS